MIPLLSVELVCIVFVFFAPLPRIFFVFLVACALIPLLSVELVCIVFIFFAPLPRIFFVFVVACALIPLLSVELVWVRDTYVARARYPS